MAKLLSEMFDFTERLKICPLILLEVHVHVPGQEAKHVHVHVHVHVPGQEAKHVPNACVHVVQTPYMHTKNCAWITICCA